MKKYIKSEILDLYNEAITVRRELHRIPEEGYKEFKTSQYICSYLKNIGIINIEITAQTGIVAFIKGKSDKTLAFRADMDGLSVNEKTGLSYESTHGGMMHACGHDGHMTILLILARYIINNNIIPQHNILLVFQPAEEGPGGAKRIIDEGILQRYNVNKIFGCHIMPDIEEGKIETKPEALMAQTGEFYINISGKSAHAANPHEGIDTIMIAAQLINSLNNIISRCINPTETALFSIGTVNGGERVNVIAEKTEITGTMRAFDEKVYNTIKDKLYNIVRGYETSYSCNIECNVIDMYPPVINNKELYTCFKQIIPKDCFEEAIPKMIAEDFSYYQKVFPGLFFYLGSRNINKNFIYGLHHSKFNFDEIIILYAVEIYSRIINK